MTKMYKATKQEDNRFTITEVTNINGVETTALKGTPTLKELQDIRDTLQNQIDDFDAQINAIMSLNTEQNGD